MFMYAEDTLQCVDIEPCSKRSVFEGLRDDVPRRAVPLQFDDNTFPPRSIPRRVNEPTEVGSDLPPDDQNPPVFKNPVGI